MTTPSLMEVIEWAIGAELDQVFTAIPAEVMFYDPLTQRVTVQPVVSPKLPDGTVVPYPPLQTIPVVFPRGGGYGITWPLQHGDIVLVVFAQDDFWSWYTTGIVRNPIQSTTRHSLSDGIAIAGMSSLVAPRPPTATSPAELVLGLEDGSMQIRVGATGVKLGGAEAVSPVAKGDVADANWASGTAWAETVRGALAAFGITVPALGATPYPINSEQAVKAKVV